MTDVTFDFASQQITDNLDLLLDFIKNFHFNTFEK